MTRAEQISEYANSFNGKGVESEELKEIIRLAIIDGAKWADNHPIKHSLPSNLDEAAVEFYKEIECYPPTLQQYSRHIEDAFKAGAEWMAGQGFVYEDKVYPTSYEHEPTEFCLDGGEEIRLLTEAVNNNILKQGDKVIVQIRKANEKEK